MVTPPLLGVVLEALGRMPAVKVVTLFGSHARAASDAGSDIDLQIVTRRPGQFHDDSWLASVPYSLQAYALRPAFGQVIKATAVFSEGEVDLVVLPLLRLRLARLLVSLNVHRRSRRMLRGLGDLAIVLRPGHRVLKGTPGWAQFFSRVVEEVPDPRLNDIDVARLADCAFADHISLRRKVARGELVAAQRWLHVHLAETNLKLMHEHRLRLGAVSFHDGRRVEQAWPPTDVEQVTVNARLAASELLAAGDRAIATTHLLVRRLIGTTPRWSPPTVSAGGGLTESSTSPRRE